MAANIVNGRNSLENVDFLSDSDEENFFEEFDDRAYERDRLTEVQDDIGNEHAEEDHGYDELLTILTHLHYEVPEFSWKEENGVHSIPAFTPKSKPGPTRREAPGDRAVDYFNLFFSDAILADIVEYTNLNAWQKIEAGKENDSRKNPEKWQDLSIKELKAFIGVKILIELLCKDRLEALWSSSKRWPLVTPSGITEVFQRDRFMQISRYLHFCNEAECPNRDSPEYDKLYKIRKLLNFLKQKFQEEYIPEQECSVDECMVPFRGRLGFKQYCKDKPVKFGVKVFMLAESRNGYNYNFEVYSGREPNIEMGLCTRVVVSLCEPLFERGYHIYTDRFYTSPLLLHYLSLLGTSGCGTVLPNRKNFPRELIRTSAEMNRGDFEWRMCERTGQVATVWCDRKPIYFLSSIHVPTYQNLTVRRKDGRGSSEDVSATPPVVAYNQHMGGVDMNDRFAAIDKSRKQYKWYMRLFRKCLMWALYNAFIIEGFFVDQKVEGSRKRDFRSFCLDVAHQLVDGFSARCRFNHRSLSSANHKRITESDHFPKHTSNNNLRCVVCDEKWRRHQSKRSKTTFVCTSVHCNVPLCIKSDSTCWNDWHTKVEYWH